LKVCIVVVTQMPLHEIGKGNSANGKHQAKVEI